MEEHFDDNKIVDNNAPLDEYGFEYNFIDTPWDDRSCRSKFGIIALLIAIFVATMACVMGIFCNHYKDYGTKQWDSNNEVNCLPVKLAKYSYVARIHSAATQRLLCVGAVVSPTSIIAYGICVRSGPVRVHLGTLPRCKNGFPVDVQYIESLHGKNGVVSNRLAVLSNYEHVDECGRVIKIGYNLDWKAKVDVIGSPDIFRKRLSLQHVTLVGTETNSPAARRLGMGTADQNKLICVRAIARCPVHVGDLLIQNGELYGLAIVSVLRTGRYKQACFINLNEFDTYIMKLIT